MSFKMKQAAAVRFAQRSSALSHQVASGLRTVRLMFSVLAACLWLIPNAWPQSSVERIETSQQAEKPVESTERARDARLDPAKKSVAGELGRVWGAYAVTSSAEIGHRFIDTDGSYNRFRSDLNLRNGLRLLDYQLDARAVGGSGPLFDYLRADATNSGGDASQYYSLRVEKARAYRFDGKLRQFNYFRVLPTFANGQHNFGLNQRASEFNLKLLPERAVRVDLGYARSHGRGPLLTTYQFDFDTFAVQADSRWESNDYRTGVDGTWRRWNFFANAMHRTYKNDLTHFQAPGVNRGNNPAIVLLNTFVRTSPARSHATVAHAGLSGNITPKLHLALRGNHTEERMNLSQYDLTAGTDYRGFRILSRNVVAEGNAKRPSATVDAALTYEVTERFSISNTFRYNSFRILGDALNQTQLQSQPPNGTVTTLNTTLAQNRLTDYDARWNTLQVQYNRGAKFSANLGWRATQRDITLQLLPTRREVASNTTNTLLGGVRLRPAESVNLFFDYENGTLDNAFVRINPLDFWRARVRANWQITPSLSLNSTFTTTETNNPTPQVKNEGTFRSYAVSASWEPQPRLWLNAGYNHDHLFNTANIAFFINNALQQGRSVYYMRQNLAFVDTRLGVTNRLDLFLVYRYLHDGGAPASASTLTGPNDFVAALPLFRHNPEARLAYRFNQHVTGNLSYRHYSYNEKTFSVQDYRANILTTSLRFTF